MKTMQSAPKSLNASFARIKQQHSRGGRLFLVWSPQRHGIQTIPQGAWNLLPSLETCSAMVWQLRLDHRLTGG